MLSATIDALQDSITGAGSEAYQGTLLFYANAKTAAKVKSPNAAALYDDLSSRFFGHPLPRVELFRALGFGLEALESKILAKSPGV